MEQHAIPNLARNETGYRDDVGNLVAVRVSRRSDGSENVAAMEVQGRVVDADGATVTVGEAPAIPAPHGWSVSLDAIVEGRTTMAEQIEAARQEEAQRTLRHRAAMEAYLEIPG